jgi:hypothetical protein
VNWQLHTRPDALKIYAFDNGWSCYRVVGPDLARQAGMRFGYLFANDQDEWKTSALLLICCPSQTPVCMVSISREMRETPVWKLGMWNIDGVAFDHKHAYLPWKERGEVDVEEVERNQVMAYRALLTIAFEWLGLSTDATSGEARVFLKEYGLPYVIADLSMLDVDRSKLDRLLQELARSVNEGRDEPWGLDFALRDYIDRVVLVLAHGFREMAEEMGEPHYRYREAATLNDHYLWAWKSTIGRMRIMTSTWVDPRTGTMEWSVGWGDERPSKTRCHSLPEALVDAGIVTDLDTWNRKLDEAILPGHSTIGNDFEMYDLLEVDIPPLMPVNQLMAYVRQLEEEGPGARG